MPSTCIMSAYWSCARWNVQQQRKSALTHIALPFFLSALSWQAIRWSGYLFLRNESEWSNNSSEVPCSSAGFQHQPQQLWCGTENQMRHTKTTSTTTTLWLNSIRLCSFLIPKINEDTQTHTLIHWNDPNCSIQTYAIHCTVLCIPYFSFVFLLFYLRLRKYRSKKEIWTKKHYTQDSFKKDSLQFTWI